MQSNNKIVQDIRKAKKELRRILRENERAGLDHVWEIEYRILQLDSAQSAFVSGDSTNFKSHLENALAGPEWCDSIDGVDLSDASEGQSDEA